nr:hypothetical protein 4 [bacterium]
MAKSRKPAKPKSELSKVEKAKRALINNASSTDRATKERQQRALKQAKLEAEAQKIYDRELRLRTMQQVKAQARLDAAKQAAKGIKIKRK